MRMKLATGVLLTAAIAVLTIALMSRSPEISLKADALPSPVIGIPEGHPTALVYLLSDQDGWGEAENAAAARLQEKGVITLGIDLPQWLGNLERQKRDCAYTVSDLESVSRQLQRQLGIEQYLTPAVAGWEAGGAMAAAIAAQSPAATLSATHSINPAPLITLAKPLCTPAEKRLLEGGMQYDLRPTPLTHAVTVSFTPQGSNEGRVHAGRLKEQHPDVIITERKGSVADALVAEVSSHIAAATTAVALPLAVTPVNRPSDLMAIIISGDGGWRDIDKKLAGHLAEAGVPSVGLDSLRYFWSEKSPEVTARDLEAVIDSYLKAFNARRVLLVGYSFGANVIPPSYAHLSSAHRRKITQVALLAPSPLADFQIAVSGWLGFSGEGSHGAVADYIGRMTDARILCLYGSAEKESACHGLSVENATVLELPGGHHFDGDYKALTQRVLSSLP